MINELTSAIDDGRLPHNTHIIVRYRPATPKIGENIIRPSSHLTFTPPCSKYFPVKTKIMFAKEDWEFTTEDLSLLVHSLYWSDIVVNTFSTLTIDAAVFDKPVIGIRFDADPNVPVLYSVHRIPDLHDHYRELEELGGVQLVHSMVEFIDAINFYLKHPESDRDGRARIVQKQIEFLDGKSGQRVAEYVKNFLFA